MADPDCIFCKIVAGELPARIVDEDERTIAFMDIAPATRGHALVIPRAHAEDLLSVGAGGSRRGGVGRPRLAARMKRAARGGRREPPELLRRRGLAEGLPLPHPRDPALRDDPLRLPWVPAAGDPAEIAGAAQELAAG